MLNLELQSRVQGQARRELNLDRSVTQCLVISVSLSNQI